MRDVNLKLWIVLMFSSILFTLGCTTEKKPAMPPKKGQALVDSLRNELLHPQPDTTLVNIYNGLSEHAGWRMGKNDTCIVYAQKAMDLAQSIGYKYGLGRAYNNMGNGQAQLHKTEEALQSFFAALEIFKETGNKLWEGGVDVNIGITYEDISDYSQALKYYEASIEPLTQVNNEERLAAAYSGMGQMKTNLGDVDGALEYNTLALNIYKKLGNNQEISRIYQNIGFLNTLQGNYPEALKIFFTGLKIAEKIKDKQHIINFYNRIGYIYSNQNNYPKANEYFSSALKIAEAINEKALLADCYLAIADLSFRQGKYTKALKEYTKVIEISDEIGEKNKRAYANGSIGMIYFKQGKYAKALNIYDSTMNSFEEMGDKAGIVSGYYIVGNAYLQLNNLKKAKSFYLKGLDLSKVTKAKSYIAYNYKGLASVDSALGNYKSALEHYKYYTIYKDSMYNDDNTKKLTQTAMQYKFDKKQLADSLKNAQARKFAAVKLEKQKTYTFVGIGAALLLLALSFFIYRSYSGQKKSNKIIAAEKQKSEELLLNILPEEVAEELKAKGSTQAKQFDEVSVLFTDFVNFTQTSEQLTPQQLVQELNECFTAFDNIIERNGLERIKTIGDAYMAVCGLPATNPEHAQRVVLAAIEISDFIAQRKLKERVFEIRIGINSGSVVAGIVGIKKFAYDIWGDTVNIAARMESSSEPGKVNISKATYDLVKNDEQFIFEARGKVATKGKGEVEMYFVENKNKNI